MGQATVGYQENEMKTEGTYQRNSQLYAGGRATVTSKQDTILSGATIDANELTLNVGGDLTMESLQDTQVIDGSSKGGSISGSLVTGTPTGASANGGKTSGERAWVSEVSGINGRERIRVNVGGTTTLTGASITNIDEHGIDQGNLEVTTQHLVVKDIKDIDTYDASTAGIAVGSNDGAPSLNSVEYTNNTKDKEQITRATIGSGTVNTQTTTGTLNRDTGNIQEITKEKSSNTELYVSNRTLDLVSDPTGEIEKLGQKLDDVGLTALKEIRSNLPTAEGKKDKEGNPIREDGTENKGVR
jgi:filamentous hemagglutinin